MKKLCVIDIAPTLDMYARTDMEFARAYYHWFHLIQPAPLPETMIGGDALRLPARQAGRLGQRRPGPISSSQRWPSTNAAFARPKPSMLPARTTAPARASTWSTTAKAVRWREDRVRHPGNLGRERRGAPAV